jgi:hypothetical protein
MRTLHTLRRLLLIAALLGSIVGGYLFLAGSAGSHTAPAGPAIACGGAAWPCM